MTNQKLTIQPADPDDLICDTCPERYPYNGSIFTTFESARVKGWHIYQHVQATLDRNTGSPVGPATVDTRILCPSCIGTPRSRPQPPPQILEGQSDIFGELGVTQRFLAIEKKGKKGREMQ